MSSPSKSSVNILPTNSNNNENNMNLNEKTDQGYLTLSPVPIIPIDSNEIKNILMKPAIDRLREENLLLGDLLKRTNVFERMLDPKINSEDFFANVNASLDIETYVEGDIIQNLGEGLDKFCLVLSGSIARFEQKSNREIAMEVQERDEKKSSSMTSTKRRSTIIPSLKKSQIMDKSRESLVLNKGNIEPKIQPDVYLLPGLTGKEFKKQKSIQNKDQVKEYSDVDLNTTISVTKDMEPEAIQNIFKEKIFNFSNGNEIDKSKKLTGILTNQDESEINTAGLKEKKVNFNESFSPNLKSRSTVPIIKQNNSPNDTQQGYLDNESQLDSAERLLNYERKAFTLLQFKMGKDIYVKDKNVSEIYPDIEIVKFTKRYLTMDYFGEQFFKNTKGKNFVHIATEDSQMMILSREEYENIEKKLIEIGKEKMDFFFSIFCTWPQDRVAQFSKFFEEQEIKRNSVIFNEDDIAQAMYLVKSGDVILYKSINPVEFGYEEKSVNESKFLFNDKTKGSNNSHMFGLKDDTLSKNEKKKILKIASVVRGHMFGEEPLLLIQNRKFQAQASNSGAIVYALNESYLPQINTQFGDIIQLFYEEARSKFKWRYNRIYDYLKRTQISNDQTKKIKELIRIREEGSNANSSPSRPHIKYPDLSNSHIYDHLVIDIKSRQQTQLQKALENNNNNNNNNVSIISLSNGQITKSANMVDDRISSKILNHSQSAVTILPSQSILGSPSLSKNNLDIKNIEEMSQMNLPSLVFNDKFSPEGNPHRLSKRGFDIETSEKIETKLQQYKVNFYKEKYSKAAIKPIDLGLFETENKQKSPYKRNLNIPLANIVKHKNQRFLPEIAKSSRYENEKVDEKSKIDFILPTIQNTSSRSLTPIRMKTLNYRSAINQSMFNSDSKKAIIDPINHNTKSFLTSIANNEQLAAPKTRMKEIKSRLKSFLLTESSSSSLLPIRYSVDKVLENPMKLDEIIEIGRNKHIPTTPKKSSPKNSGKKGFKNDHEEIQGDNGGNVDVNQDKKHSFKPIGNGSATNSTRDEKFIVDQENKLTGAEEGGVNKNIKTEITNIEYLVLPNTNKEEIPKTKKAGKTSKQKILSPTKHNMFRINVEAIGK